MRDNDELIRHLRRAGVLRTKLIADAFQKIDRVDFVKDDFKNEAYADYPLPIGFNQTISQPTTVAFMLELLQPKTGNKILDVGSGSGWTTALLAQIVGQKGQVIGIEKIPELAEFGQENLKKYPFSNAQILPAVKTVGLAKEAPFDKILVSASAKNLPQELIKQLRNRSALVIPISTSIYKITKDKQGKLSSKEYPGFVFVPLIESKS